MSDCDFCARLFVAAVVAVGLVTGARGEEKVIRVAIFDDAGVTKAGIKQVEKCLPAKSGFSVGTITAGQIRVGALRGCDVLSHGGGSASKQGEALGAEGREAVRKFVEGGGGFIGICAGAYLASAEYEWSLGVLDAHVLDRPHWARGQGNVELQITAAGAKALATDKETCTIHFENGPLLGPGNKDDIDDYEPLASYATEMRKNDAPPGMMKGTTAIARGKFGKGRVVCFSPHPEKTPGREAFLQAAVEWAVGMKRGDGREAK